MTDYGYERELQAHFRELAALDRQLTRWGWFRRYDHRPRNIGWRFRIGQALICLGCRLQAHGAALPTRTPGEP